MVKGVVKGLELVRFCWMTEVGQSDHKGPYTRGMGGTEPEREMRQKTQRSSETPRRQRKGPQAQASAGAPRS